MQAEEPLTHLTGPAVRDELSGTRQELEELRAVAGSVPALEQVGGCYLAELGCLATVAVFTYDCRMHGMYEQT